MRGLRQKLDALRVQNRQSLSKYKGFIRKLIWYKGISFSWTYLNSILFVCSNAPFKATSSFHPHSMCIKVERVTAKTWCTSCTKRIISFVVQRFHTKTRLLQRDFIFWTYLNSRLFCVQNASLKATSSIFNPFRLHLLFFMHLLIFFWAIWPWKWKALQMNSEKVESWHGIIISPT